MDGDVCAAKAFEPSGSVQSVHNGVVVVLKWSM